ncbi:MAG TPA: polyprenol monophosphomannose synthase [Ktedonobacteraceae bacterium]|nr:polyprenol monophosphomannose synthase [Ktedonobacteraceae bacterium]
MFTHRKGVNASEGCVASTEKSSVEEKHEHQENVVIIPTYNEAINLKLLVPRILQIGSFDVLIVDDNSPDGTGVLAEEFAKRFPGSVYVLHRPGKLGLGSAYRDGFHRALEMGYRRVFTMDADLSHDPGRLPSLGAALDGAEVVLGSRYVPGGSATNWPLRRRLLSRGGSVYARLLLGLPVHDLTGGFKGFRCQVLETLLPEMDNMRSNGYVFQIETTYLCARRGFRIVEVPILFENRLVGTSKMNPRIVLEALRVVLALRLRKGSARAARAMPATNSLPPGRVMAVIMALIGLMLISGTAILFPRWLLQGAGAGRAVPVSHMHAAPSLTAHRARAISSSTPAMSQRGSATIQLQGAALTSNVPLVFKGSGFRPGEEVTITVRTLLGQVVAMLPPVIADKTGQFSIVSNTVLSNLTPGYLALQLEGVSSHRWAQARFHLDRIPPLVQLDTYTVKPPSVVGFYGSGFLPGELVDVYLGKPGDVPGITVRANAGGNIAGRFPVPLLKQGNYTLFFVGHQSQTPSTASLNVQGFHPWVILDNYAPPVHARLGFTGEDFVAGEEVMVYLTRPGSQYQGAGTNGSGKLIAHIQADKDGRFAVPATWEVPDVAGNYQLVFMGQESGAVITTPFTVLP